MTGPGEPFYASWHSCGGYDQHPLLAPQHCRGVPDWAGLVYYPHTREVWWAFACDDHRHLMQAVRPVTELDLRELTTRALREKAAREGHGWVPPKPIRTGADAAVFLSNAIRATEQAVAPPPVDRKTRRKAELKARRESKPSSKPQG